VRANELGEPPIGAQPHRLPQVRRAGGPEARRCGGP
jgi:hypothetical protein